MLNSNIMYQPVYNNSFIQFDPSGIHGEIMNAIHTLLEDMLNQRSKIFYLRFDLHFPAEIQYPPDNTIIESFMSHFMKSLYRQNIHSLYIWVREQKMSINHHYHVCLFLDGQKVQHKENILKLAQSLWTSKLNLPLDENNGLVHYCDKNLDGSYVDNGIKINRNSPDFIYNRNRVIFSASYLAKTYSKNFVNPGVRQFSCSRRSQQHFTIDSTMPISVSQ